MKALRASGKVVFSEPLPHFVSFGGFEIVEKSGKTIAFDFNDSAITIEKKDVIFELRNLDMTSFPDADKINWNNIEKFTEFYIYQYDENTDIYPVFIEFSVDIEKDDGKIEKVDFDKSFFSKFVKRRK